MRVGKWLEHLQSAVKATMQADPVIRMTAIGRQVGYAVYLFNDTLVWVRLPASDLQCTPAEHFIGNSCIPQRLKLSRRQPSPVFSVSLRGRG